MNERRNCRRYSAVLCICLGVALSMKASAGPYAPAAGQPGSTAVFKTDPALKNWATGYQNYNPGPNVDATFRTPDKALGAAVGNAFDIVSLGNAGTITLTFSGSIYNGSGYDFAVFENGFSNTFLELAFVEVSSDGTHFFRFPSFSFTPSPVGAFGAVDPTNIDGLAGKYRQGYGTPFDLNILKGIPGLDINNIGYVRLVDVVGNGSERDALGNRIYDPYPTTGSIGFDLDAIGVRYLHIAATSPITQPVAPSPVPVPPLSGGFAIALGVLAVARRRVFVTAAE